MASQAVAFAADPTPISQYYQYLTQAVQAAYGNLINGKPYPVQAGGQGDFPYNYLNSGSIPPAFTLQTLNYISADVIASAQNPGSLQLQSGGSFQADYLQLIDAITYQLNAADLQTLTNAQNAAVGLGNNLVQQYQSVINGGPITAGQIAQAQAALPRVQFTGAQGGINFVMNYVLGLMWSAGPAPLTWQQMQNAQNLQALLPNMPAAGPQILPAVTAYLNAVALAVPLNDELVQGTWTINQMKMNLQTNNLSYPAVNPTGPGPAGMFVSDPTGQQAASYTPAYAITRNAVQIANDLASPNSVQVSIEVTSSSSSQFSLSINGQAGINFGGPFLTFSGGVSGSLDMVTAQGAGSSVSIVLTYKGFSNVPIAPSAWSGAQWGVNSNFTAGWYYPTVIQEAHQNFLMGSNAPSGFTFISNPPFNLANFPAGNFSNLTNVLISNYPTVSVQYHNGNYSNFSKVIATQASGSLKLFGFIPIGSASMSTYSAQRQDSGSNTDFSVNFAAPTTAGVPTYQQTAYVIGACINSPGNTTSVVKQLLSARLS